MIPRVILRKGIGGARIRYRVVVSQVVRRHQGKAVRRDYIVGERRAASRVPDHYYFSVGSGLRVQKLAEIERPHLRRGNIGVQGLAERRLLVHRAGIEVSPAWNQRAAEFALYLTQLVSGLLRVEVRLRVKRRRAALVVNQPVYAVAAMLGDQVDMYRFGGIHTGVGDRHLGHIDEGGVSRLRRGVLCHAVERPRLLIARRDARNHQSRLISLDRRGLCQQRKYRRVQVDKRSVLPRQLEVDDAGNRAILRLHHDGRFVDQDRSVVRFRLELWVQSPDLPGPQHDTFGLKGLEMVRVDLDGVRPGLRNGASYAPPAPVEISRTESSLPASKITSWILSSRRSGGVGDASAKRGRLRLREQQGRRNQEEHSRLNRETCASLVGSVQTEAPEARHTTPHRDGTQVTART